VSTSANKKGYVGMWVGSHPKSCVTDQQNNNGCDPTHIPFKILCTHLYR
jgi:hypothetical protein